MQEPNPMPTGDQPWSHYHKSNMLGATSFAAFFCGLGLGFMLSLFLTPKFSPVYGGLTGAVLLTYLNLRVVKREEKKFAEIQVKATRQKWAEKEAETLRKIKEMKLRNATK